MKKALIFYGLLLLFSCENRIGKNITASSNTPDLWPAISPYNVEYLKVSDIHELYLEEVGNPNGKPVIMLHGGPGGGCSPMMRQFFNPEVYRVILFDQRGANRSKPYAEIKENNTLELVEDIEKIRKHLNIEKMMLVGGSWGSTLALAYAESYPERVTEMVLRGIWMGTQKEIDHFYHGGTYKIFPDAYTQLMQSLPDSAIRPLPDYLLKLLTGEDEKLRTSTAEAWLKYEWRISDINVDTMEINLWLEHNDPYAFSLIENYYMAHHCFLDKKQLWENLERIKTIPTILINGRFDIPCLPETAYDLHKALPQSELIIVEMAGHGGPRIINAMARAIRKFEH
ncbi:MAG: prolyl aminopeptidase [Bacteroidetes bacterium]|nr:prolyl aminopeptidase [Bacteroidota bacterium]